MQPCGEIGAILSWQREAVDRRIGEQGVIQHGKGLGRQFELQRAESACGMMRNLSFRNLPVPLGLAGQFQRLQASDVLQVDVYAVFQRVALRVFQEADVEVLRGQDELLAEPHVVAEARALARRAGTSGGSRLESASAADDLATLRAPR